MDKMVSTYSRKNKYMSFSYLVILHKYSYSHALLPLSLIPLSLTAQADPSKRLPSTYDHGLNSPFFLLCLSKFILISDYPFGSNNSQGFS